MSSLRQPYLKYGRSYDCYNSSVYSKSFNTSPEIFPELDDW